MACDNCGSNDTYVKKYYHKYDDVKFYSNRRFCSKCNSLVYDEVLDNEASRKAIREHNKLIGVDPDKIISLRKKYNLTQEQFSKIIGCAKKTLISYERGTSIPNDNYLVTMKTLLDNPEIVKYLIESNIDRYEVEEYNNIVYRLSDIYNNDDDLIDNDKNLNEFNGYTEFSFDKVKNLLLLLAKNTILKTKLLKEMFYCDFLCYKYTGKSITGLEYYKYKFGPVPKDYELILDKLFKSKYIDINTEIRDDYEYNTINSLESFNDKVFDKDELEIINKVIEYFKDFSSTNIVDYSHKEKAFTEPKYFDKISYEFAFDLLDF